MHHLFGTQIFWLPLSSQRLWFNPVILMSLIDKSKECDGNKTIICVYRVKRNSFFSVKSCNHALQYTFWVTFWHNSWQDRSEDKLFFMDFCELSEIYHVSSSNNCTSHYPITPQGHKTPICKVTGFYWWVKEDMTVPICFWTFSWYWEFHETKVMLSITL